MPAASSAPCVLTKQYSTFADSSVLLPCCIPRPRNQCGCGPTVESVFHHSLPAGDAKQAPPSLKQLRTLSHQCQKIPEAEQEAVAKRPAPTGLSCLELKLLFEFFSTGLGDLREVRSLKGLWWEHMKTRFIVPEVNVRGLSWGCRGLPHPIQRPAWGSRETPVPCGPTPSSFLSTGRKLDLDQTSTSPFFTRPRGWRKTGVQEPRGNY